MEESSSTQLNSDKPVIVRVKRKTFQSPLDAFWLEIHERPLKKPLLDFGKLSISDATSSRAEELKTKKVLVRHVETVISSEDTFDVLRSFMPNSSDAFRSREKYEGRNSIKTVNKRDQILTKVKERQEVISRNARFEQVWRSRRGKKEAQEDEAIYDMCRLYDVVRVDVEEREVETRKQDTVLDDCRTLAQFLPLLKEVLPTAAEEIENDFSKQVSDGYVYDFYAVNEDTSTMEIDSNIPFPLVQVDDDDDFYDGPDDDSECDSIDSNAENNPLNDYPDEEVSEDEDEVTSKSSDAESEVDESRSSSSQSKELGNESQVSYAYEEDSGLGEWSDFADQFHEDEDEEFW